MPEMFSEDQLSEADYHAQTGVGEGLWVTRSIVKDYLTDPAGCHLRHVERHPYAQVETTEAMDRGTLFEDLFFGRSLDRYAFSPAECESAKGEMVPWNYRKGQKVCGEDRTTTEWRDEHVAAGRSVIPAETYERQSWLVERFRLQEYGRKLLAWRDNGRLEQQVTVRWEDPDTGLPCQVRLDFLVRGIFIGDLKSTKVPLHRFVGHAVDRGWDLQESMYSTAWRLASGEDVPYVFAASLAAWPFTPEVAVLPSPIAKSAERRVKKALDGIAAGNWSSDRGGVYEPPTPSWVFYQVEADEEG